MPAMREDEKQPSGLPPVESTARRVSGSESPTDSENANGGRATSSDRSAATKSPRSKKPVGLGDNMTKSARLRLQLALDEELEDEELADEGLGVSRRPVGLKNMTTSARHRLQLALDEDIDELEAIRPPRLPSIVGKPSRGSIPFDEEGRKTVRSLGRWVMFCGLLTLTVGALTGLSYLTGPGSVAHVVVGILACALSVWLLAAARSLGRVLSDKRQQHHLVDALGLLRSALLLKAILLFSAMVLGCFTFSIATALLFLL